MIFRLMLEQVEANTLADPDFEMLLNVPDGEGNIFFPDFLDIPEAEAPNLNPDQSTVTVNDIG